MSLITAFGQAEASSGEDIRNMVRAWRGAAADEGDVRATAGLTNVLKALPVTRLVMLLAFAVRQLALAEEEQERGEEP